MAFNAVFLLCLFTTVALATSAEAIAPLLDDVTSLNRSSFPTGFIFGTASSAYQVYNNIIVNIHYSYCTLYFFYYSTSRSITPAR